MTDLFTVEITRKARKELDAIDAHDRERILRWMKKHLDGCENPRLHGKPLSGTRSDEWSYRVGNYRILAEIRDNIVTIYVLKVAHRSKGYRPM